MRRPDHAVRRDQIRPISRRPLALHRARDLFVKQRTTDGAHDPRSAGGVRRRDPPWHRAGANAGQAHRHEVPDGTFTLTQGDRRLGWAGPGSAGPRLGEIERELLAWHRSNDTLQAACNVPGIKTVCATALAAYLITDPHQFRSGRQFAALAGLDRYGDSSGGIGRLGRSSNGRQRYLRRLLVVGMTSLIRRAKYKPETVDPWLADLLSRKPARLVTVALANKAARVVWAVMVRGGVYRRPATVTTPV